MRGIRAGVILVLVLILLSGKEVHAQEYRSEDHEYSEWYMIREPACTEIVERYKECLLHGGRIIEELAPTGHQYEMEEREPTCTEDGVKAYLCSVCGDRYEEEGAAALGHNFRERITRTAVCEQEGELTHSCTRCEEQYTEVVPGISHSYGAWVTEREAQSGKSGRQYQECYYCSDRIYREIAALPEETEPQSEAPPEPERAGRMVTVLDVVIITADISIFALFFFFIQMDIGLILWNRRQRKRYEQIQEKIRKNGDNCGFH